MCVISAVCSPSMWGSPRASIEKTNKKEKLPEARVLFSGSFSAFRGSAEKETLSVSGQGCFRFGFKNELFYEKSVRPEKRY